MSAQPWIAAQAEQLLAQRGHAWLLQGPSGLGQFTLAMDIVRAWLCERATPQGACGSCESCHQIDVHSHTDLCMLMPETVMMELGWPLAEKAQSEIDDKKRKPSKEIRVEAMRDAIEFAQRTSGRGRGKAVLVYPAERMNHVTANALLKTLEEPAGDTRFVLATDAAHLLLPTIRSRCIAHTMAWPSDEEATAWLAAQEVPRADIPALLQAAGGRPEDALGFARAGGDPKMWASLPKAIARGDGGAISGWHPAQAIDALTKICHDLLAVKAGAQPRFFSPGDLPVPPTFQALNAWARELMRAARTAEHPLNAGLMHESLVSQARQALNSKS
nr:DNA polymerase III subunit delta' [Caenimonas sp. SL110]